MTLVYFVVLVGVLIFVHELGHFAWAKFFGVKVLKFSLGFGPKLLGFRRGETEYQIAAVPLGGYVKMLGESANDVIRPEDEHRAFSTQPLFKRFVIVIAGPAMNLVFPIALFFIVYLGDGALAPAVIGTVYPGRPADGKLEPGDRIVAIDGEEVTTFEEVQRIVGDNPGRPLVFDVERGDERRTETITPVLRRVAKPLDLHDDVGRIYVMPNHPMAVVGVTSPNSPAGTARMRPFDMVVSAGGRPIDRWLDLADVFHDNRGTLVPVAYLRPVRVEHGLDGLVEIDVYEPHVATVTPEPGPGPGLARAGIEPAELYVSHVMVGSPEQRTGIHPGDRIVALDGWTVPSWAAFIDELTAGGGREHLITLRRGEDELTLPLALRHVRRETEHGQRIDSYDICISNWVPTIINPSVPNPHPVTYAAREAFQSTWEMVELTAVSVLRLLQGRLTMKSIGGPITIYNVAGAAAREGTLSYLELMAFISVNLGLINLLPIPLLDGGHLLFFVAEAVSRRRPSTKLRQWASLAGLSVLVFLIVLAFKNDIERNWPQISETLESR